MIPEIIENDEDTYFTIAYILMTIAIVGQVIYYSFVVYSYQNIRRKLIEKGRLLQITPIISIATVCVQPNQATQLNGALCVNATTYPGSARIIDNKIAPPPYYIP